MQPQVILITGASSGFGKITAQMLSAQGHIVYGTSRKLSEDMNEVKMLVVDVTNSPSIRQAIDRILSEQGRIDVLINNAGMGIGGALELATEKEVNIQMNTNFFGVVNMCREVLPVMRKNRKGKIINISSIGGVMGIPYQGFYSASKFAVEGYSEALALEVHPFNIKVCVVEPGDFKVMIGASSEDIRLNGTLTVEDYQTRAKAIEAQKPAKRVSASTNPEDAENVLDEKINTAWQGNKGDYITFALKNGAKVDKVAIAFTRDNNLPATFEIQLSGGGGQFLTIYSGTVSEYGKLISYPFKGTTASDLRIVLNDDRVSIAEVKF